MSNDSILSDAENKLIDALRFASDKALACVTPATHDRTKWQLVGVAILLRDRMRGIMGGAVRIAPKAIAACMKETQQVSDASADPANGPSFDRVVVEGRQAIDMIDASDTAKRS